MKKISVEVFIIRKESLPPQKFEGDDAIECAFKWLEGERKRHPERTYRVSEFGSTMGDE